jgi:hypothetical protein
MEKTMAKATKKAAAVSPLKTCHYIEEDGVWVTPKGRGMFVALARKFQKKGDGPDKAKYAFEIMVPPDADLTMLYDLANEKAAEEGWKGIDFNGATLSDGKVKIKTKAGKVLTVRSPFLDAEGLYENVTSKGEEVDLEGWITIRTASKQRRPVVRDASGEVIDVEDLETEAYSGRWARIMVKPYAYDVDNSKGVAFGLESVQLLANDDKYGSSGSGTDGSGFGAVDDEDGEDDDV